MQKPTGQFNHCLADYIAPRSRIGDCLGGFAVSIHGADELAEEFKRQHDDYSAIMTKALADRLAEAFAEYLHQQARIAWGFGRNEQLSNADLIREKYGGIRPAAGYPACPDHAEKRTLFDLLDAENSAGIKIDGIFCNASRCERERALFFASAGKIFRCRPDRARPGNRLCDSAPRSSRHRRETARAKFRIQIGAFPGEHRLPACGCRQPAFPDAKPDKPC